MQSSRHVSWFQSVTFKIVCITLVLNTLILGGFAVYNMMTTKAQMESDLRNLAEVTATRLSKHVMIPLWDLDKEQIDEMLRSEMLEKHLAAIVVRDNDGKTVFAGKERGPQWQVQDIRPQGLSDTTALIHYSKRIEKGLEKIGEVEVYLTPKFLHEELQHSAMQVGTSVLVLDVVMFIVVLLALRRLVIKPIGKLAAAAESMSLGDFDVAIGVTSRDEIGHVADAMERMKISLQMAMQHLQQRR